MTLKYLTIVKSLTIVFFISSCALNSKSERIITKPEWITDPNTNVGCSGFIPSQIFSTKKDIAIKNAIHSLIIKKGKATGSIFVKVDKNYFKINSKEGLIKRVNQNSIFKYKFDVAYSVKTTELYIDPETQGICVKVEER